MTVLLLAYYYYYADQLNSTQVCLKTVAEWLKQTELSERTIKANRINEVNRYSLLIIIRYMTRRMCAANTVYGVGGA